MTDDVRLSTGFPTHRKTKRLKRVLGAEGVLGLIFLWAWAGRERWSGDLGGLSDEDIEDSCGWDGQPGALIGALSDPKIRFIDGPPGERALHDWAEHNPFAAGKGVRIARGKKGAEAMWAKRRAEQAERQEELDLDASSMPGDASSNATSNETPCPPAPAPAPAKSESSAREVEIEATAKALTAAGCPDAYPGQDLILALAEFRATDLIGLAGTPKYSGKSLAYLLSTLRGRRRDAAAGDATPNPAPPDPALQARAEHRRALENKIIEARHLCEVSGLIDAAERDRRIAVAERELRALHEQKCVTTQKPNPVLAGETTGEDAPSSAIGGR